MEIMWLLLVLIYVFREFCQKTHWWKPVICILAKFIEVYCVPMFLFNWLECLCRARIRSPIRGRGRRSVTLFNMIKE